VCQREKEKEHAHACTLGIQTESQRGTANEVSHRRSSKSAARSSKSIPRDVVSQKKHPRRKRAYTFARENARAKGQEREREGETANEGAQSGRSESKARENITENRHERRTRVRARTCVHPSCVHMRENERGQVSERERRS